jgi:hypothetical protein
MIGSRSLDDLRQKLKHAGHRLVDEAASGVRVLPTTNSGIVVATRPDVTLYPEYRQRFFLCREGAEAVLTRTDCPPSLSRQWGEMLSRTRTAQGRELLAGPGAWALSRAFGHNPVLIWAVGSGYWEQSYCESQYELIESELGRAVEFEPWRKHLLEGTTQEAYYLSPHDEEFPCVLAAYFFLSSYNHFEVYVTDDCCAEVYEIHHHDKVTASAPAPESLQRILQVLTASPDLYSDISRYLCEWDEQEDAR